MKQYLYLCIIVCIIYMCARHITFLNIMNDIQLRAVYYEVVSLSVYYRVYFLHVCTKDYISEYYDQYTTTVSPARSIIYMHAPPII